ncbi:MAG: peptidylprolyl isomerase [Pseudomonadota bacterium]
MWRTFKAFLALRRSETFALTAVVKAPYWACAMVALAALSAGPADAANKKKKQQEERAAAAASTFKKVSDAPVADWRTVDPENMLVMDLPSGEVVIELRPDIAPLHVDRLKTLTRQGFYDGLKFHRVIEGFMAQGGDPKNDGTGGSELPNLEGEFVHDAGGLPEFSVIGRDRVAARIGFSKGLPIAAEPDSLKSFRADRRVLGWPAHCPGVMSMARATRPNSANSQFFLMIGDSRSSLDKRYSVWGLIVDGFENSRRISRGEPPTRPTPIIRMRIGSDMPENEQPNVQVMSTSSDSFKDYLEAAGHVKDGLVKDLCNIRAPRKVNGKVEL